MDDIKEDLFDHLEDVLVAGFRIDSEGRAKVDDIQPILETARALLMAWRGVEPFLPRGFKNG